MPKLLARVVADTPAFEAVSQFFMLLDGTWIVGCSKQKALQERKLRFSIPIGPAKR
jgi:hypothetical protein